MNYFKYILFFLISISGLNAQNIGHVPLVFIEPQGEGLITQQHYKTVQEKIKKNYKGKIVLTNQSSFDVIPNLNIVNIYDAGEMQTSKVAKIELEIQVKDNENGIYFNEFKKVLSGSGKNEQQAITNALQQLKNNDLKLQEYFENSNKEVVKFYRENCDKILKNARVNIQRKEYNKALTSLQYIPDDTQCFATVEQLITSIYLQSKEQNCLELVKLATLNEAKSKFNEALNYLVYVDPTTSCYQNANTLISKISEKVTTEEKQNFDFKKQQFDKLADINKVQILAENVDYLHLDTKL